MKRWYAVNTQPHREHNAILQLRRQRYEAWLPMQMETRRHARRFEMVKAPLFPSYLFVRLDLDNERWRPINGTFGVRRLVMCVDAPAPVTDGFVDALLAAADDAGLVKPLAEQELKAGDAVKVISGPFAEMVGTLLNVAQRDRIAVLLSCFGRESRILLPRASIAAA